MTKKHQRLSRVAAIARIDEMIRVIQRDVHIGIEVEAALETANEFIMANLKGVSFYGAECYNSAKQSMALFLALTLAKLFETPTARRGQTRARRYNRSDLASIPLMIRLLKQKRCQTILLERARTWTPHLPSMGSTHITSCSQAIQNAIDIYERLNRDKEGRSAIAKLKEFRNKALAHALLGQALKKTPSYSDLFLLMDIARDVTEEAQLAITGNNLDLRGMEKERVRMSQIFWKTALTASIQAEEGQS